METYISVLRGINVSGQKKILMTDVKAIYEKLGFKDVKTYIQSGNVVFKSEKKLPETEAAQKIEDAIQKKYNFHVPVIIRSLPEIKKVIESNSFLQQKDVDLKKLHVTFLSEIPSEERVKNLENLSFSPDQFIIAKLEHD